ncbi:signal peptidase I [Candidatus Lokiarchaeum ossiferum]|uniref:signal peptidase I n=1 Tax=Candidatus Lokiarchaeum ossiferum TaxID=2951803 RepID=UPI00352E7556
MTKKPESAKSPASRKKEIIRDVIFFAVIIGFTFAFMPIMKASLNTDYPLVVVTSGSMEPLISRGDLLVIEGKAPEDIEVGDHTTLGGDIILYDAEGLGWSRPNNEPIIHRCVNKTIIDGVYYFTAFGDHNNQEDPVLIPEDHILGVERHIIPVVGWPKIWMAENSLFSTVLLIGLAILLVVSVASDYKKSEDEKTTEIEEAKVVPTSDSEVDLGV